MRVVVISYHYPPDPAVGGLRAAKVAEAFRAAGHEVHVVAAVVPEAQAPLLRTPSGITIERVVAWRNPREWWAAWKRRRAAAPAGTTAAQGAPAEASAAMPARVPAWKRLIFSALWLPDDKQGFAPAAARAARRAFGGGADLVYTSAPPFSGHLAGLWLRARHGIRWVAEFRDPWTDNAWKPAHVRSAPSDAIERWLERRTVARSERIVAVSEGIARLFRSKLPPADAGRVLLVRNGIERLAPRAGVRTPGPRRVVHVGSFYFGRDPRLFLAALAEVVARRRLGPDDLQVELVGRCRWYNGISVEEEARRLGLATVVQFQDWVPHDVCQGIISDADVLLLLAQHQPDQVPNKLYEYLGTRIPILAFADADGETAGMLREAGGHELVTGDDVPTAAAALERALGLTGSVPPAPDEARLRSWTTEGQMRQLLAALGG